MLAQLFHTPPAPHPPNQQCFPWLQGIERIWGSRESSGDRSLNEGDRARSSSPAHSVATQSFREHVALEQPGLTHPERGGKKKLHSENWERSPMDPSCSHCPKCLASDMASERQGRSGRTLSPPVKTGLLPDLTRSAERSAATKELPGRQEKKTSPRQLEIAGQRPKAPPSLLQEKMSRG
jgi:hypothetical protein